MSVMVMVAIRDHQFLEGNSSRKDSWSQYRPPGFALEVRCSALRRRNVGYAVASPPIIWDPEA
jgi:hypothetical protein